MGLSPAVAAVVDDAADLCLEVIETSSHSPLMPSLPKGYFTMIRRFAASLVLAAVAGLVLKSLPDIARYLKMREM